MPDKRPYEYLVGFTLVTHSSSKVLYEAVLALEFNYPLRVKDFHCGGVSNQLKDLGLREMAANGRHKGTLPSDVYVRIDLIYPDPENPPITSHRQA